MNIHNTGSFDKILIGPFGEKKEHRLPENTKLSIGTLVEKKRTGHLAIVVGYEMTIQPITTSSIIMNDNIWNEQYKLYDQNSAKYYVSYLENDEYNIIEHKDI